MRRMKGASAYELNHQLVLPERFAWQEGYWAESVTPADHGLLAQYVQRQREHHDPTHPAEQWANNASDARPPTTPPVSEYPW